VADQGRPSIKIKILPQSKSNILIDLAFFLLKTVLTKCPFFPVIKIYFVAGGDYAAVITEKNPEIDYFMLTRNFITTLKSV